MLSNAGDASVADGGNRRITQFAFRFRWWLSVKCLSINHFLCLAFSHPVLTIRGMLDSQLNFQAEPFCAFHGNLLPNLKRHSVGIVTCVGN